MLATLVAFAFLLTGCEVDADKFAKAMDQNPLYGSLIAFGAGLGTCLTPCVYPMIAITVSVFGAKQAKSRGQAMLLSTSFVLGIVALFTPMMMIAALTGKAFGTALSNPWVVGGISIVFIATAASMFGAFEMTLPESWMQRLSGVGGAGYGGAFALGLVSGLVAAPCTGPILTVILTWIGTSRNIPLGAGVGVAYSIGLGLPFWLVGTFAVGLPKGGKWMVGVKSFFGIVMLIVALYFLRNPLPILAKHIQPTNTFAAVFAALIVVGVGIGAVHLDWSDGGLGVKIRKGVGIAASVVGGFGLIIWISTPRAQLAWLHSESEALAKHKQENRPLIVDFTATWCVACQEMAKDTFGDPRVMAKAGKFVAVKIDATDQDDPSVEQTQAKYKVVGLPTVLLIDSKGNERKRFTEFVGPERFLTEIEGIE
ncbi:MAG: thioredoxin family protein [Polyangiaceae bacterium]|nr:thioredoxin family protein [Polyangiaceae bacterium]